MRVSRGDGKSQAIGEVALTHRAVSTAHAIYVMQTRTARALALLSCLAPATAALDSSASALWAALNTVSIGSAPSL